MSGLEILRKWTESTRGATVLVCFSDGTVHKWHTTNQKASAISASAETFAGQPKIIVNG